MRIQPSELMKIAMPLMLAWYFQRHEAIPAPAGLRNGHIAVAASRSS
jgi:rod shape determining protein RodA